MDRGVFGIVHELTKDANVPTDIVNNHITQLQSMAGMKSGTVQDVPAKHLQELASKTTNQKEFIARFTEAKTLNGGNLAPMLEVLHGITGNEHTQQHLLRKAKSAEGSTDYLSLKEKLLQQVGSRAFLETGSSGGLGTAHMKSGPFMDRKLLTLDFVPDYKDDREVGPLGCVPVNSQESAIVQDLLFCFVGIGGMHIKPQRRQKDQSLVFEVDPNVDPSLKELLARITPLCQHYSTVVRFVESRTEMGCGRVNQALAEALSEVIKDYYVFVAQLETQHRLGELTLNKMWSYIQPTLDAMAMMADLCQTIDRCNARGGKTLSLLHEKCVAQSLASSEKLRDLGLLLVKAAAKSYFEILRQWLHRGTIHDPGKDFFVEDNEVIERSALPLEYSDDYWERRYSIKADQIPAFLHSNVDKILRTGKYLNVIQQCDQGRNKGGSKKLGAASKKSRIHLSPFRSQAEDEADAHTEKPSSRIDIVEEELVYKENPEEYNAPLERAYAHASKNLLELLVKDRDLIGHLRSVKHYFLLDQGDFIVQFMDLCGEELCQNVDSVEPTRLESLLELALRTSSANEDPYKDNVRVELLPYDLIYQMCKILSIDTESEAEFKGPVNTSGLTGLEAFAFGYDVQWPISLILNRKSLACYQMLLRHLLYCKHVEKLLTNVWITTKGIKTFTSDNVTVYVPSLALKQKMLHFLQNLEYYMTFEVLEPNWEDLIARIRSGKVANVDQVLQIHSDFLSTCLNDCLLSNPQLLTTVKKLLGVCSEFAAYMNDLSSTLENVDTFAEDINKFDLRFTAVLVSLLDKISKLARENYNEKILNILYRLDFNGFYSKALDTFGKSKMTV